MSIPTLDFIDALRPPSPATILEAEDSPRVNFPDLSFQTPVSKKRTYTQMEDQLQGIGPLDHTPSSDAKKLRDIHTERMRAEERKRIAQERYDNWDTDTEPN